MQKPLKLLEKNVEWIALGLGALWVLWVVWSYWICSPVSKEIAGKTVTPATIDSELIEPEAKQLDTRLSQAPPKELKPIELSFSLNHPMPQPLTAVAVDSRPIEAARKPTPVDVSPQTPQPNVAVNLKTLPKAVTPIPVTVTFGRVLATVPAPAAAPAAAPVAGAAPAIAVVAGTANAIQKDIRYASAFFFFPVKQQDKEFAAAGVPAPTDGSLRSFRATGVTLQRQEVGPDGKDIGSPVEIAILPNRNPIPDRAANLDQFVQWVSQSQAEILNPPFLPCVQPTEWQGVNSDTGLPIPLAAQVVVNPVEAKPDPLATAPGIGNNPFDAQGALSFYNTLSPADQTAYKNKLKASDRSALNKAQSDAKKAQTEAKRQNRDATRTGRNPNGPPPPPPPGRTAGRGDAQDPTLFSELYAQASMLPPPPPPGRSGMLPPPPPPGRPGVAQPPAYQAGIQAGGQPSGMALSPNKDGNLLVFAHDITGEAGKTYKYRIKLVVMNPLYQNPAASPDVAKVLELDAQFSDWTQPVTFSNDVELFFAGTDRSDGAKFVVQRWQNGQINPSSTIVANPGDSVGYLDKATNIDFTTGWMVADIDPSGNRVTLVNADGQTMVRTEKEDKAKLNAAPTPAPATPAAAAAATPAAGRRAARAAN